jgi:HEAT repeat protein
LAEVDADALAPFCREALADPAPLVRRFAVGRCSELPAATATELLLNHLGDETDLAVWRTAYDVLRGAHPTLAPFADSEVTVPDERGQRLAAWRAAIRS